MITIALAGNPNCGKTTLFNALTGATAHVGNWPGVTVDKLEGVCRKGKEELAVVDLPGIYSLSPYTPEEIIARNYILNEKPSCVVNVVDASNLERNLYLTTQLLEIDVPVVIALNMMDVVEKNGMKISAELLAKQAGVPVVSVSALKNEGMDQLVSAVFAVSGRERKGYCVLEDTPLSHLVRDVKIALDVAGVENPLFHAIKLIERDEIEVKDHSNLNRYVDEFKSQFSDEIFGNDFEAYIADARYKYVIKYFSRAVKGEKSAGLTKSDKADRVLTHKWLGIPIFLAILFSIFHFTFSENFLFLGALFPEEWDPLSGTFLEGVFFSGGIHSPGVMIFNFWNDVVVAQLFGWIGGLIESTSLAPWAVGLLVDGVLGGLSAVLSFLPQILILFLFFSILEDSGYMARIAFILDKLFRKFGLSGRAFMPMIMGFGCSVPAMINTRTLADDKERTATIRVIPFFSCGAKLPILTAISGAIAVTSGLDNPDLITYGMYLLGILVALASVILMRSTTMRGEAPPFIMELPAYHSPGFKNLMLHLWDKAKHFIQKAFTVILASTIVIWFLSNFTFSWELTEDMNESILASLGQLIRPFFTPLGFGSQLSKYGWVFAVAAITGLIAKEDVIGTIGTLAACLVSIGVLEGGGLVDAEIDGGISAVGAMIAATGITTPALIAFIAFNMLTVPCFASVATAKAELSSKKTFGFTVLFWIATSYLVSSAVYLIGTWWWTAFLFGAAGLVVIFAVACYNKARPIKAKEGV